jgi:hypothetical protein
MNDPLTSGTLSRPNGGNPLSWGALSTAERRLWIPAKILHYSNDCSGVGKTQMCEIFATDAVLQVSSESLTSGATEGSIRVRKVNSAATGVKTS